MCQIQEGENANRYTVQWDLSSHGAIVVAVMASLFNVFKGRCSLLSHRLLLLFTGGGGECMCQECVYHLCLYIWNDINKNNTMILSVQGCNFGAVFNY